MQNLHKNPQIFKIYEFSLFSTIFSAILRASQQFLGVLSNKKYLIYPFLLSIAENCRELLAIAEYY